MKILGVILASFLIVLSSMAATTVFPASTNGNNVFTGNNTFTKPINGDGRALTNVNVSFGTLTNQWGWIAFRPILSISPNQSQSYQTFLVTSEDGTNFTDTTIPVYSRNQMANGTNSPNLAKVSVSWFTNYWVACAPGRFDGWVDFYKSFDLTNWSWFYNLKPLPQLSGGIADSVLFNDPSTGTNYIVLTFATNGVNPKSCLLIPANDNTLTNWSPNVYVLENTNYSQSGSIVRDSSGIYHLFYECNLPSTEWLHDTNTTLFTPFWHYKTNFFGTFSSDAGFVLGKPQFLGGQRWRFYGTENLTNQTWFIDSYDDLNTWSGNWTMVSLTNCGNGLGIGISWSPSTFSISDPSSKSEIANLYSGNARLNSLTAYSLQVSGTVLAQTLLSLGNADISSNMNVLGILDAGVFNTANQNLNVNAGNLSLDSLGNMITATYSGDGSQLTGFTASQMPGHTTTFPVVGPSSTTVWVHFTNGIFFGVTTNSP